MSCLTCHDELRPATVTISDNRSIYLVHCLPAHHSSDGLRNFACAAPPKTHTEHELYQALERQQEL